MMEPFSVRGRCCTVLSSEVGVFFSVNFAKPKSSRSFYFAHSFTLRTDDHSRVAAWVDYGAKLVAAVRFDTIFAVQFHPEKSQKVGERLLANFDDIGFSDIVAALRGLADFLGTFEGFGLTADATHTRKGLFLVCRRVGHGANQIVGGSI